MKCNCENSIKTLDSAILAYGVLLRLGCGKVDSFADRIKSQKVQYFAQIFKVSPNYHFNLYLRGPYSPSLSNDLFRMKNEKIDVKPFKFVSDELEENFEKLRIFIKGKTIRQLELASTLHWLLKKAGFARKEAINKLKELKNAYDAEVKIAFSNIENI